MSEETTNRSFDEPVELLRVQLEDVRADRDAWREQARRSDYMANAAMERTRELESRIRELEAPQSAEVVQEGAEPRPSTGGAKRETTRPPTPSTPTSRLGMSGKALAVGAVATVLTWSYVAWRLYSDLNPSPVLLVALAPAPLLSGLWAGSTKRPSLPWFSSPHRWLRRGGRSVLEIAMFATAMPAWVCWVIGFIILSVRIYVPSFSEAAFFFSGTTLYAFGLALLPFMSGAFLGNALRRLGVIGTPKEPEPGQEDGDTEQEEVWSPRQEARWGLIGTLASAVLTGIFSVVVALID